MGIRSNRGVYIFVHVYGYWYYNPTGIIMCILQTNICRPHGTCFVHVTILWRSSLGWPKYLRSAIRTKITYYCCDILLYIIIIDNTIYCGRDIQRRTATVGAYFRSKTSNVFWIYIFWVYRNVIISKEFTYTIFF